MLDLSRVPFAPYYSKSGITIYNADCRQVLPFLPKFDVTVSSPPYNTIKPSTPSGMYAEYEYDINKGYDGYADDMPENDYQEWVREVFQMCRDVTEGLVWINHKTRFRDKVGIHPLHIFHWPFYSEIIWERAGSTTLNARKFAPSHEFIYGFGTPHFWNNKSNTLMTVWKIPQETQVKSHPCPFPLSIASRCINASCPPGGSVLDPFLGSGTTLVAAKLAGCEAAGIEINEAYCAAAVRRLSQNVLAFTESSPCS